MTTNQRRKVVDKLLPVITFLIGLGLGEALRRLALYLGHSNWINILYMATKLGIIGYMFYLGVAKLEVLVKSSQVAREFGATYIKYNPSALLEPVLYWLIAAASAAILF